MNKETQTRTTLKTKAPNTPRRKRRARGIFSIGQYPDRSLNVIRIRS